jgi:enterochelin esterase family protein
MTDDLFNRARLEGAPLIDGDKATFVWRGPNPPVVMGDFNDWDVASAPQLSKIGPNLWAHSMTFPHEAYIEYVYSRRVNPPRPKGEEVRLPDPLNKRRVSNGLGKFNYFFYMPEGAPSPYRKRPKGGLHGAVTAHTLEHPYFVTTGKRAVELYRPATKDACPLLVVFDGPDYARRAQLVNIVDNLIAAKRIKPLALALLANGKQARLLEYAANDATLFWIVSQVIPLAREQGKLVDVDKRPGAFGALGASMGGLMALYAGLRFPTVFGHVLSQSGAFSIGPAAERHPPADFVVYDLARDGSARPKVWLDVGKMESLLEPNRRMHTLLQKRGYPVTYREFNGGHNFTAWGDDVAAGLEALFG